MSTVNTRSSDYVVIKRVIQALKFIQQPRTRYEVGAALKVHDRTAYRVLQAMVDNELAVVVSQSAGRVPTTYKATKKLLVR